MKRTLLLLLLWAELLPCSLSGFYRTACHAQTSEQWSLRLDEVGILAQRRLKDAGVQQTSIDTAILHQNVSLSMSDILTQHSTLFIKSYGRATESTAEFRGTSPAHTQVLWNGMKINSPMLGTVDFSTIPSYFVDQANLLHGASSLTLTGGGLGGAVDLSTLPVQGQGTTLQYIQGIGSFDTYDQFLRLSYGNGRWSTSTRLVYARSDNDFPYTNYDKKVDVRDDEGHIVRSYHPRERNRSGYFDDFHLLQELYCNARDKGRFSLAAWYSHSLRGLPFLSVDYKDNSSFSNEQGQDVARVVAGWSKAATVWNIGLRAGYVRQQTAYDYSTTYESVSTDITHAMSLSQQGFLRAGADWMPHRVLLLTAVSEVYYNHVYSVDKSPFHIGENYRLGRPEYHLSLSAKWRPRQRMTMSAVLRGECYGDDLVPPIPALFAEYVLVSRQHEGLVPSAETLVVKASAARNYRYPSMDDLYFKPGGNPDLRPEKGLTADGGLELSLLRKGVSLKANLSAFDSHITDWILWTPNAKGYWQPSNLKRVHSYGTEMSVTAGFSFRHDWHLDLTGNYAYTPSLNMSREVEADDASYGKQLVYVPRHSANLSGQLSWRSWALSCQWMHYSERFTTTSNETAYITGRLKPFYMNNLSIEKSWQWKRVHTSLKGVVNNVLDTEYVTVLSRPMAGRNFELFLEIKPQWPLKSASK